MAVKTTPGSPASTSPTSSALCSSESSPKSVGGGLAARGMVRKRKRNGGSNRTQKQYQNLKNIVPALAKQGDDVSKVRFCALSLRTRLTGLLLSSMNKITLADMSQFLVKLTTFQTQFHNK